MTASSIQQIFTGGFSDTSGFTSLLPDLFDPEVGDVLNTATFLQWVIDRGLSAQVDPATHQVARLEFLRAGGTELNQLIADMAFLTSGTWHQGSDGVNDYLFSDRSASYDKPDVLDGRGGDYTLEGGGGDDLLRGGTGNDLLLGWGGDDVLRGGADDDRMHGGDGNDLIDGGTGRNE